jgi:hypothetical protein
MKKPDATRRNAFQVQKEGTMIHADQEWTGNRN